jgi:hypothetical protein
MHIVPIWLTRDSAAQRASRSILSLQSCFPPPVAVYTVRHCGKRRAARGTAICLNAIYRADLK